jgi:hypothetical protein
MPNNRCIHVRVTGCVSLQRLIYALFNSSNHYRYRLRNDQFLKFAKKMQGGSVKKFIKISDPPVSHAQEQIKFFRSSVYLRARTSPFANRIKIFANRVAMMKLKGAAVTSNRAFAVVLVLKNLLSLARFCLCAAAAEAAVSQLTKEIFTCCGDFASACSVFPGVGKTYRLKRAAQTLAREILSYRRDSLLVGITILTHPHP